MVSSSVYDPCTILTFSLVIVLAESFVFVYLCSSCLFFCYKGTWLVLVCIYLVPFSVCFPPFCRICLLVICHRLSMLLCHQHTPTTRSPEPQATGPCMDSEGLGQAMDKIPGLAPEVIPHWVWELTGSTPCQPTGLARRQYVTYATLATALTKYVGKFPRNIPPV